jgi:hypothetical protein
MTGLETYVRPSARVRPGNGGLRHRQIASGGGRSCDRQGKPGVSRRRKATGLGQRPVSRVAVSDWSAMLSFARRRLSAIIEGLLSSVLVATFAAALGLAAFALAATEMPSGHETRDGVLSIRHGDDFTNGRIAGHEYFLTSDGTETQLLFEGPPPDLSANGEHVRLDGVDRGGRFLVAAGGTHHVSSPSTSASVSTGARRVAVVLLNFSNDASQPYTPSFAAGVAFTNTNSVAAYYAETSHGQLTLSGDVFGWYTIPESNANCSTSSWASSANAAAAAVGVDLNAYDNVVYAFPTAASCPWAGLAQLPGRSSWLNGAGSMGLRTLAHELGHNFGTHHASTSNCTENGVRVSFSMTSTDCTVSEYGDPFTLMGQSDRYEHTNFARGSFGWLQPAHMATVTSSGEYTLEPIENGDANGLHALRLPRTPSTFLTLEFRHPNGSFDTFSATMPVATGVSIRITPDYALRVQSQLVDATPATASFIDAPLAAGSTLGDPVSGISITTLSTSSLGATVRITFGTGGTPTLPASATPTPTPSGTPSPSPIASPTPVPTPTPIPTPSPAPPADVEAPTTPTDLSVTLGKGRKLQLSWSPSSDDVGVVGYQIYLDGAQVGTSSGTTFAGSLAGKRTTTAYWVVAYDLAGNLSSPSQPLLMAPP